MLLVEAKTGVHYLQQCNGGACEQRGAEGFLVPLSGIDDGEPIPPPAFEGEISGAKELQALADHVGRYWCVPLDGRGYDLPGGDRAIALDRSRLESGSAVEAFVPVTTPWGPGWLLWENSD